MSNWNQIPYEIQLLILLQLRSSKKAIYQCLFVNKQWFTTCQSILYKSVKIGDLEENDKLVNTLLNSTHCSGQLVRQINFRDQFLAPVKSVNHSPLQGLMINCPHVEKLDFGKYFSFKFTTDFDYFLLVLKVTNNWKLSVIPDPDSYKNYGIHQYKQLADLMKDSLTHIVIEKRNSDDYDDDYFTKYPKLSSIRIDYHTACILDCVHFITNIPRLDSIQVKFNKYSAVENNSTLDIAPFSKIKKLHITNFKPHKKDLTFIMDKFTEVVDLSIKINNCGWIEDQNQLSALSDFVKHVTKKISKFCIAVKVIRRTFSAKISDKKELFKHCFQVLGYDTFKIHSHCRFRDITEVKLSNDKLCLNLDYSSSEFMSRFIDIKAALKTIGQYPRNIIFVVDDRDDKVNKYLDLVFTFCPQLTKLDISGGALSSLFQQAPNNTPLLSYLVLREMNFFEGSLSHLSSSFTYLQVLRLERCKFPEVWTIGRSRDINNGESSDSSSDSRDSNDSGDDNHKIKIMMSNTEFKLLEIVSLYRIDSRKFTVFVEVTLIKSALQQYYVIHDSGKSALKVSRNKYDTAVKNSEKRIVTISLIVSSIETFKFSAPGGIQFKLEFI